MCLDDIRNASPPGGDRGGDPMESVEGVNVNDVEPPNPVAQV